VIRQRHLTPSRQGRADDGSPLSFTVAADILPDAEKATSSRPEQPQKYFVAKKSSNGIGVSEPCSRGRVSRCSDRQNALGYRLAERTLVVLLVCFSVASAGTLEQRVDVEDAMRRANDYFQLNHSLGNEGWERSTYQTGNFRAWQTLGVPAYYDEAVAWGEANFWDHGTDYGDVNGLSADAHCCGQTYLDLYHIDPQPVRTNLITELLADILLDNRPASVDDWWWIDAFYMAGPTLARLGVLNSDPNYLNQMYDMYNHMKHTQGGGLFHAAQGLWWRDSGYKSSAPDVYWGRGNGWVIAACARVLEQLPPGDPTHRPEFESMLQTMAAALLPWQQADGFWRADLTHPTNPSCPNPETSSTAFFTYAIAYGINEGLLVDSPGTNYTAAVTNAWNGLVSIALQANGKIGYTQAVGSNPQPANPNSERDYGCGAFLLAGSEILRLLGGPVPVYPSAGPDLTRSDADGDQVELVTLSATNSMLRSGTIAGYSWWSGTNLLGNGPELTQSFPLGTNIVTLHILHSDGNSYPDSVTVVITAPVSVPPPLARLHFDFEDSGNSTADQLVGATLDLRMASGAPGDLHGPLGSGVAGAGRALDLTSATAQGGSGPIAVTEGNTSIEFGTLTGFTVTLWIKPTANLLTGGFPRFFSLGTNGTTDRGNPGSLQLLSNGNLAPATAVQGFVNAVPTSTANFGAANLPVNQWRFLALTYDGVTLNYYVGAETNSAALISAASFPAGTLPLGASWSLFLGNRLSRDRAFRGWLDDVRFYEHAAPLEFLETVRRAALAEPVIAATPAGTNLMLRLQTKAGSSYVLESATNLAPPVVWAPTMTNLGAGGWLTNTLPLPPSTPKQFFRYSIQ
jgi:unsaturated rhamnogalacturonyl hydrolase